MVIRMTARVSILPFGGSQHKEKKVYEIRHDNEGEWPAAPIVNGEFHVRFVRDPRHPGQVVIKCSNRHVRDKHGEQTSFLSLVVPEGLALVSINPKHFSPASQTELSVKPRLPHAELKPAKRVAKPLTDAQREARNAKARANRERKKLAERAAAAANLGEEKNT
jgi:hypothetical protein